MTKLSIIIPVFGVEQYVERCLTSVLGQDVQESDYELIIVNDGTKDNSWEIVKKIVAGHNNVVLYEQSNQGLSAARNKGLDLAHGEYIWFVDSDDFIEERCLSSLISFLSEKDVVAICNFIEEGDWTGIKKYKVKDIINTKLEYLQQDFPTPAQFYICKRQFLLENQIRFVEGIKHEDCLYTPIIIEKAKSFLIYREPVYHFLKRPNSITTVFDSKRASDYCFIVDQLFIYSTRIKDPLTKNAFKAQIARIIKAHLALSNKLSDEIRGTVENFYSQNQEIIKCLKKSKANSRLVYCLYKTTPFRLVSIYKFLEYIWSKLKKR